MSYLPSSNLQFTELAEVSPNQTVILDEGKQRDVRKVCPGFPLVPHFAISFRCIIPFSRFS